MQPVLAVFAILALAGAASALPARLDAPVAEALGAVAAALPDATLPVDAPAETEALGRRASEPTTIRGPLVTSRFYVVIDAERRSPAPPAPEVRTAEEAPILVRLATIAVGEPPAAIAEAETSDAAVVRTDLAPAHRVASASASAHDERAVLASVVVALTAQALLAGAVAMYHRIAPSQALTNGTRSAVAREVAARGHATAAEVAHALSLHPKTAKYHLDLLANFRLLVRDPDGAYRAPGVQREAEPTIEDAILELVEARPGINMTEIARAVAVSKSTAQERVTRLLLDGRIESRRDVRARLLFPARAAPTPA